MPTLSGYHGEVQQTTGRSHPSCEPGISRQALEGPLTKLRCLCPYRANGGLRRRDLNLLLYKFRRLLRKGRRRRSDGALQVTYFKEAHAATLTHEGATPTDPTRSRTFAESITGNRSAAATSRTGHSLVCSSIASSTSASAERCGFCSARSASWQGTISQNSCEICHCTRVVAPI